MPKYDFTNLTDKEFEELCRDLLNAEHQLGLQAFKRGRDKGIDLRYATNNNRNAIVVQVKQCTTDYQRLFSILKKDEVSKVMKLQPGNYWFVTTLPLSAKEKDEIVALFRPFMDNANMVLGADDLNGLLNKHEGVLKSWLKLWLTNTVTLERILNNALNSRSDFYRERIRRRLKLYVLNKSLNQATQMLLSNRFLIISGQPGVGKTTLADILTSNWLAQDHELIYVDKDIEEAGQVFHDQRDRKQLIYFDDFLGANHFEILTRSNNESALVRFIERVQASDNKFLILTTRTTIMQDAKEKLEKLNRTRPDLHKMELTLDAYSLTDKAKILYNHLYHSSISVDYKNSLLENNYYWKIIRHDNYNPRLIEFFTDSRNLADVPVDAYPRFIFNNLNDPREIWRHSFLNQLGDDERFMVLSMFTFGVSFQGHSGAAVDSHIGLIQLREGFAARTAYEVAHNNHKRVPDAFNASLRRLLDGYLVSSISPGDSQPYFQFLNPSIIDFLKHFLSQSIAETWRLIKGAIYIHQLRTIHENLFLRKKSEQTPEQVSQVLTLVRHVWEHQSSYRTTIMFEAEHGLTEDNAKLIDLAVFFSGCVTDQAIQATVEPYLFTLIQKIDFGKLSEITCDSILSIILEAGTRSPLYQHVLENFDEIAYVLWQYVSGQESFEKMDQLFNYYGFNIKEFVRDAVNLYVVTQAAIRYMDDRTADRVDDAAHHIMSEEDLDALVENVAMDRKLFFQSYGLSDPGYDEKSLFETIDWRKNRRSKRDTDEMVDKLGELMSRHRDVDHKNEAAKINDLFSGSFD